MLRDKPSLKYCGLTVVLSNPSRFDKKFLLTANAGVFFNECLQPDFNQMQCDVRVMEDTSPLLPNTKCILLLGEAAMKAWCPIEAKDNLLNELRGSVLTHTETGTPCIASFFPQDAMDLKNHEAELNEQSKEYAGGDDNVSSGDDEGEDEGDVKRHSATKRSNYSFWLKRDIWKAKQVISGKVLPRQLQGRYHIYPTSSEVVQQLTTNKNQFLYLDIETDYEEQNLLCFAFSFDGTDVFCVPVLDYNYHLAYSDYYVIMRALAIAVRDNIVVSHNGSGFDFLVLAYKYHIAIRRCYDTMLAMHRCYPAIEKSLGHCVSYWTWQKFHKDTDSQKYYTFSDMQQKLRYCGADVFTMASVHKEIESFATTIPGLPESIKCANDSIPVYLYETLRGIKYDQEALNEIVRENDRLMNQYIRMSKILLGEECLNNITSRVSKTKTSFLGSDKQQCIYFHELLEYPVVFRSPKTGDPSLGKKIMYSLALKHPDNPLIPLILAYRKLKKETGALKFIPWRGDDNEIYIPPREATEIELPFIGQLTTKH